MMRSCCIMLFTLAVQNISGQYTSWNNIYEEQGEDYNFLYNSVLREDSTFLIVGWGYDPELNEIGWRFRRIDSEGDAIETGFASGSMPFQGIGDCISKLTSGNFVGVGARLHGLNNYHPYVGCISADWDTLWNHDCLELVHDSLQIFPTCFLETGDHEILVVSSAYLNYGISNPHDWGYHFTFLDEETGTIISDTLRWMEDDFYYSPANVAQMSNGELLISGLFAHNEYDSFLMKTNLDGDILATKHWGNQDDCIDAEINMNLISDTLLLVSYNYCYDYIASVQKIAKPHLLSMNPTTWEVNWDVEYDEPIFNQYGAGYTIHGIERTPDGGYGIAFLYYPFGGDVNFPTGIIKTDNLGNMEWFKSYHPDVSTDESGTNDVVLAPDGGFIVSGMAYYYEAVLGLNWVFKTDPCGDIEWVDCPGGVALIDSEALDPSIQIWPNPSNGCFRITYPQDCVRICMYNELGQTISNLPIIGKDGPFVEIDGLAPGLYLIELDYADKTYCEKVIVHD